MLPSFKAHVVYWLGGSPCSGKSSVGEAIAARHGFSLFRSDDIMVDHMASADPQHQPAMAKVARLFRAGGDAMWMRPVDELLADMLAFYREEILLMSDVLMSYPQDTPILAEGNAWLPELLRAGGVTPTRAVYLVPTRAFQQDHYSRRQFIQRVLAQCADPQAAFANWMERDARFGELVSAQAAAWGAPVLHVDGSLGLEETGQWVEASFGLV